jgi:hypothetical protein
MLSKSQERMLIEVKMKQYVRNGGSVKFLPAQENKKIVIKSKAKSPHLKPSGWMRKSQ